MTTNTWLVTTLAAWSLSATVPAQAAVTLYCKDPALRDQVTSAMGATDMADLQRLAVHAANRLGRGVRPNSAYSPARLASMTFDDAKLLLADSVCREVHSPHLGAPSTDFLNAHFPAALKPQSYIWTRYRQLSEAIRAAEEAGDVALEMDLDTAQARLRSEAASAAEAQLVVPAILNSGMGFASSLNEFWFNHFNVSIGATRYTQSDYIRRLRTCQMGTFRELLECAGKHPAMLSYLDQAKSVGSQFNTGPGTPGINENYARELLELHTLGIGPRVRGAGPCSWNIYDQADVTAVARILTGWGYATVVEGDQAELRYVFRAALHDSGDASRKTALCRSFHEPEAPEAESTQLLDFLASHPRTKANLCGKLIQRFLGTGPTASPDARAACVNAWGERGDLRAIYKALVTSPDMWSRANLGADVKDPLTAAISLMRVVGMNAATLGQRRACAAGASIVCYPALNAIKTFLARTGLPLCDVAPPTGYDEVRRLWATPALVLEMQRLALSYSTFNIAPNKLALLESAFATALADPAQSDVAAIDANTATPLMLAAQPWVEAVPDSALVKDVNEAWIGADGTTRPLRTLLLSYVRSRMFLVR